MASSGRPELARDAAPRPRATRPSSASRCTPSSRRARRCSAAARRRSARRPTPRPARSASGCPACCRWSTAGPSSSACATALAFGCRVNAAVPLRAQALLLPGHAEELPDQPVRGAAGRGRAASRSTSGGGPRGSASSGSTSRRTSASSSTRATLETAQASLVDFNRAGRAAHGDRVASPTSARPRRPPRTCAPSAPCCSTSASATATWRRARCAATPTSRSGRAGSAELGTKVEIKNLNSFRNVQRALEYEVARQARALDAGERIVQETRLWDADRGATRSMRSKEYAHDYRYFPEPDLVPLQLDRRWVDGDPRRAARAAAARGASAS